MGETASGDYAGAFVKAAEQIVRLTSRQELLKELGKIIVGYFRADWVAFVQNGSDGAMEISHCTLADEEFRRAILENTRETVRYVLNTGLPASSAIDSPATSRIALLPLQESTANRFAALIGHDASTPPTPALLDLYSALTGLAGSTLGRIVTERELRRRQDRLRELVKERTAALEEEIAERKQAQEKMLRAKEDWERTFNALPDLIAIIDDQHRILRVNAAMARSLGRKAEDCIGLHCFEAVHGSPGSPDFCPHSKTLRDGLLHVQELREDGLGGYFLVSTTPLLDAQGQAVGTVHLAHNITDRKLREARIIRLTQLYAMLVKVNEAIVRTLDRGLLYEEVCRIITEERDFPLVWIGEERDGQVMPAAFCGLDSDYLREIKIEVDGASGERPLAACIREDRPVVNNDFAADGAALPWREQALGWGFRSSAAFPLHCQGKVVAVLVLYGKEPHDFDAEDVDLLETLASDISYALDAIERERIRTRAEADLHQSLRRFELLAYTAEELLQSPDPQKLVNSLCREVMEHLGCQAFFNFLVVEEAGRLRLNAYAGIPEEEARKIQWLDYGVAVCGCAARDACRIVAEHIPATPDPRTDLVKSYGIKAYACHPLYGPSGTPVGTLSFGTCDRETFSDEDLSLMKAVADQVAVAMTRMKDEEAVKRARDELEERVRERTAELQEAYDKLILETNEREKAEHQLRQAQKLEALGTLAGGIAHDFNNLLAAVIGFGELIKDHAPKESRERRHAERILVAGVRGRELVRQMLTFSRRTEEEKKPLHLSGIVNESVKLLRASIPSSVSIRLSVTSESGLILGDPVQIQQILMNLATNAAYAMREQGGSLEIDLSDFSISTSSVNLHRMEPGRYMKLAVRDTGVGMPSEIMDKIFDPFFTTKKVGEGTGLGLSVVLGIVKQSRGYIFVESEPGKGSTFEVYFPKVEETSTAKTSAADEIIPVGRERILFVDDEEALAEMGEELLAELGYEVACHTSSRQALAAFRLDPSRFDLVITDQTMPEMTGVQLVGELLAIRPDIPVILCTGFSHAVDEESAQAAGIKGFVMKPLTKREIARAVRRVLDER